MATKEAAANEPDWGFGGETDSLPRFPAEEIVLGPMPFDEELFVEVDRLLALGRCPAGRLEVETSDTRLTCLIHQSAPFIAGLLERDVYSQVPLYDFTARARQLEGATCSLVRTDNSCVLMVAVHFCKRPYLQGSTRLVNPAHVLRVLAKQKHDAALAFERSGNRSLLFLSQGKPARLFFGDPSDDPGEGDLSDRILLYAFADSAPPGKVEVYTSLKLPADPDRGISLTRLAALTRPCPPAMIYVLKPNGEELRRRVFLPPSMVIGRDPTCTLFIDDLAISRQHARLSWEKGQFVVEDLKSANGTLHNGSRVQRAIVSSEDLIEVGKFQITIDELEENPTAPETLFMSGVQSSFPAFLVGEDASTKLERDVILGRGKGVDIRADGIFVAAVHARITRSAEGDYLVSCFGNRKVRINGSKVSSSKLEIGDQMTIGISEFKLASGPAG